MRQQIQQGIDVALWVGDKPVAGQQNISFSRQAASIDITNKITGDWQEKISGLKTWSLTCSGMYIIDDISYDLLEEAFMNGTDVIAELRIGDKIYKGKAIITEFPLSSAYNTQFKYIIKLLGNGALEKI